MMNKNDEKHKHKGIKIVTENLIFFVVCFAICVLLLRYLKHIDIDKALVTDVMKSTLTFSSIMFGFFGTLIVQIINLKSKYQNEKNNSITLFFEKVNNSEMKFVLYVNIISMIILDSLSLLVLLQGEKVLNIWLYIWSLSLIVFIVNQWRAYRIFILLLFTNQDIYNAHGQLNEEEAEKFNESLSNKLVEKKPIKLNQKRKKSE